MGFESTCIKNAFIQISECCFKQIITPLCMEGHKKCPKERFTYSFFNIAILFTSIKTLKPFIIRQNKLLNLLIYRIYKISLYYCFFFFNNNY